MITSNKKMSYFFLSVIVIVQCVHRLTLTTTDEFFSKLKPRSTAVDDG
jgi:hypothetical protein